MRAGIGLPINTGAERPLRPRAETSSKPPAKSAILALPRFVSEVAAMPAEDEIRPTRMVEIGAVLTARGDDAQALMKKGQRLLEEIRQAIHERRLDEAQHLRSEVDSILVKGTAEKNEVLRLTQLAHEAFEAVHARAADVVASDESLRSQLWGLADRGDAGIRWLLEELVKKDHWWQRNHD